MTTDRFAREWVEPLSAITRESTVAPSAAWRVNAVKASSIKPVPIRWLWPGWLAQGKLHILAGAGGTGKTTLLLGLIATITTAGRWPDGELCREAGNVLIWSSEDDPSDTLVPRLIAAGADMDRVHIIQGRINAKGESDPFDPGHDIGLLRETARDIGGISLLMLDPVVSAVKGDMHKANDVRRGLQGVVDFAEQNMCAVVGISHFAKGGAGSSPADRVIGSQAFSALARTVLVAAKQEDSDLRVLARAKSNIGTDEGGVSYTIETSTIDGDITTTHVAWGDLIEGSAREILGDVESTEDDTRLSEDDPSEALRRILKDAPMIGKQVKNLMTENGYSAKQTRTAREKLSVVVVREGFGKDIRTLWSLPQAEGAFSPFPPSPPFAPINAPFVPEKTQGHEWEKRARMGERAPMPFEVPLSDAASSPSFDDDAEDL